MRPAVWLYDDVAIFISYEAKSLAFLRRAMNLFQQLNRCVTLTSSLILLFFTSGKLKLPACQKRRKLRISYHSAVRALVCWPEIHQVYLAVENLPISKRLSSYLLELAYFRSRFLANKRKISPIFSTIWAIRCSLRCEIQLNLDLKYWYAHNTSQEGMWFIEFFRI